MTWTKLSDDFSDDCDSLSDSAFRLHVEALVWNGRKLLDCRVPKDHLRRFATCPDAAAELVAVGWWTVEPDCYVIRHHARYQRLREQVVRQQQVNTDNGRKGGKSKRPREVVDKPASDPVSEPPSDPYGESESERDGPGQDRTALRGEHMETENDDEKETVPLDHDGTCADCGAELPLTADALLSHRCVRRGDYSGGSVEWNTALRSVTV